MSETEYGLSETGSAIIAQFASALLEQRAGTTTCAPLIVGLCGAQGIGKSTLAKGAAVRLERQGWRVLLLSLDDLYLPRTARALLARDVHPLFATRGVPGTHDVPLGLRVLEGASRQGRLATPRFDKAMDDRAPRETWTLCETPVDLVLFEGWCVGARPQPAVALAEPVNDLERVEDPQGVWRRHVNRQLAGPYRALFDPLDALVLLAAPGFDVVAGWRGQQERERRGGPAMQPDEVERFVRHYERITRHILSEMPGRADLVLRLDAERRIVGQTIRSRGSSPAK